MNNKSIIFNSPDVLKKTRGFIQCGASIGEEYLDWKSSKIKNQIFIEPIPVLCEILKQKIDSQKSKEENVYVFNCAISNYTGEADFHISTGSYCSSSLLPFHKEATKYGNELQTAEMIKVPVFSLDDLIENNNINMNLFNMLYMDVQGNEHLVIDGFQKNLKYIDFIYTEVQNVILYEGIILKEEFNEKMNRLGFQKIHEESHGLNAEQSDIFYVKKK